MSSFTCRSKNTQFPHNWTALYIIRRVREKEATVF